MKHESHPYVLLDQIADKVKEAIRHQPPQKDISEVWNGIGFVVSGRSMAAAMGEVTEIITLPKYTYVPGAKSWVMGIANVRGTLIPIIDLEQFFGGSLVGNSRNYRVLVVDYNGTSVGLVVSKVVGMQHVDKALMREYEDLSGEMFAGFVDKTYSHGGQDWYRLQPSRLFESEDFINASQWQQDLSGASGEKAA